MCVRKREWDTSVINSFWITFKKVPAKVAFLRTILNGIILFDFVGDVTSDGPAKILTKMIFSLYFRKLTFQKLFGMGISCSWNWSIPPRFS